MVDKKDRDIIRMLASEVAQIASLPIQEEKKTLWKKLNGLQPQRPMVMIDQICWNEFDGIEEMTLQCTGEECRTYEQGLRRQLYQWRHFPVDMVVEPCIRVPKAVHNSDFGITVQEETAVNDPENEIMGHLYENQFQTMDDLEKIRRPRITHDEAETARRLAVAHELFDGLLEVVPWGYEPYVGLWDPIATWMGVQTALFTIMENPELIHGICRHMTDGYLDMLDQLERQGLLCEPQSLIHCTGAYTDELPAAGYRPEAPRTRDIWMYGLAQMFSTVSPEMFEEFEVAYSKRICERFGMVYYGCCEPLDGRMAQVRKLPNVRKISMSPWADQQRGAEEIGGDFVFSRKPNPSLLAMEDFDTDTVRKDLEATKAVCRQNGCPLEIILKDLSTIRYKPERLSQWGRIAMAVACNT